MENATPFGDLSASRMTAEMVLREKIRHLRVEIEGYEKLLAELPVLSPEADEALWRLLVRL